MKTQHEFSAWSIRNRLDAVNNKVRNSKDNRESGVRRKSIYTWVMCYSKARNKLMYRFMNDPCASNKWDLMITNQIDKMKHRHDPVYQWSIVEYYNCDKVNYDGFKKESIPNTSWRFKASEAAGDLSKRVRSRRQHIIRSDHYDWLELIDYTRRKFSKIKTQRLEMIDPWILCFRANHFKISKYCGKVSWTTRYYENNRKLSKMIKNNIAV